MRPSLETGATGNTPFTAADLTAREDQLDNTNTDTATPPQTPSRRSSSHAGLVEMPTTTKEQQCLY